MARLLHVVGSPRGERSASVEVAEAYIAAYQGRHPGAAIDTLDLWREPLPEFDRPALEAKYAGLAGVERSAEQNRAWDGIRALAQRFHDADVVVFSIPMWNFGIPYKLKHLIDYISQKDVLFRFDASGFEGMLKGKKAIVVCARGISYATGTSTPEAEYDFQKAFMLLWLRFIGITDAETIVVEQTLMGPDADRQARQQGIERARALAQG
ncbi:MAG: NAD(P)H-dependent oxidoreductase [Nevskia sp.]|nr:NAD(P)H-dependent oxidoreductase [Nevskia sp.]